MAATEKVTYCRICEPLCGMVATVEDGKLTKLRPDNDHPLSKGFACPKGIAMTEVQNDPDRVLHPLRRRPDGSFERVSWEAALDEIGERLGGDPRPRTAATSIGWYMGNPGAFSYSHPLWVKGFLDGLGSPHYYTASSQDVSNRFAASSLLYGSPFLVPIPDLAADRLPARRRRQPAGLPRQRAQRAADQGPAPRDRRARRAGGRRRPAALGDRARVRARRDPSRLRRLAAALAARGHLRRGPRGPRRDRSASRPAPWRCAGSSPSTPPEATEAPHRGRRPDRSARWPVTSRRAERRRRLRPHRLLPGPQRHARRVPARRAQPGHRQPRPRGRRDVRRPADRLQPARRADRARRPTPRSAPGSATCPRCSARCPPR